MIWNSFSPKQQIDRTYVTMHIEQREDTVGVVSPSPIGKFELCFRNLEGLHIQFPKHTGLYVLQLRQFFKTEVPSWFGVPGRLTLLSVFELDFFFPRLRWRVCLWNFITLPSSCIRVRSLRRTQGYLSWKRTKANWVNSVLGMALLGIEGEKGSWVPSSPRSQ